MVRAANCRNASSLAEGCPVRCELFASDGSGVENASAQARHQRAGPSAGVNIQRGVAKGYENTSMNTGLASQPHCQLLLAPCRRNKPTLGKNTARKSTRAGRHLGGVGENERVDMKLLWADGKTRLMALGEGRRCWRAVAFTAFLFQATESPEWRVSNRWTRKVFCVHKSLARIFFGFIWPNKRAGLNFSLSFFFNATFTDQHQLAHLALCLRPSGSFIRSWHLMLRCLKILEKKKTTFKDGVSKGERK